MNVKAGGMKKGTVKATESLGAQKKDHPLLLSHVLFPSTSTPSEFAGVNILAFESAMASDKLPEVISSHYLVKIFQKLKANI